jgi:hypothetical protein
VTSCLIRFGFETKFLIRNGYVFCQGPVRDKIGVNVGNNSTGHVEINRLASFL